ncbi:conserved hypothetical protein, partial [Ricinus communis]
VRQQVTLVAVHVAQLEQHRLGLRRYRHDVHAPRFDLVARDLPFVRFEVDLRPVRATDLDRAREEQHQQPDGQNGAAAAILSERPVDRLELVTRQRTRMLDGRRDYGAAQDGCGIGVGPLGDHRILKDCRHVLAQLDCHRGRAALLHALHHRQDLLSRDLAHRLRADVRIGIRDQKPQDLRVVIRGPALLLLFEPLLGDCPESLLPGVQRFLELVAPCVRGMHAFLHQLARVVASLAGGLQPDLRILADREHILLPGYLVSISPELRARRAHLDIKTI